MDERDLTQQERSYLSYVRERLGKAESALRDEGKPIRERLERSHRDGLSAVPVEWIPATYEDEREEFEAITAMLARLGPAMEKSGSVQTTVWLMSEEDAEALAERILAFINRFSQPH